VIDHSFGWNRFVVWLITIVVKGHLLRAIAMLQESATTEEPEVT